MMHTFEVHVSIPGVGSIGMRIMASSSFAAQQAVLKQYPNGSIGYVKQID